MKFIQVMRLEVFFELKTIHDISIGISTGLSIILGQVMYYLFTDTFVKVFDNSYFSIFCHIVGTMAWITLIMSAGINLQSHIRNSEDTYLRKLVIKNDITVCLILIIFLFFNLIHQVK